MRDGEAMETRRRVLFETGPATATLTYYPAGSEMAPHVHERRQLSFLLAGEVQESVGGEAADLLSPGVCSKPSGLRHANRYGRQGALILALNLAEEAGGEYRGWRETAQVREAGALAALCLSEPARPELVLHDFLALEAPETEPRRRARPAWLETIRERLAEAGEEELGEMAEAAGVHPVSLSRAFRRHYGVSPSLYRARCKLARAVGAVGGGTPIALAAIEGGFADQAHFSRALKREAGLTPRALQQMIAA